MKCDLMQAISLDDIYKDPTLFHGIEDPRCFVQEREESVPFLLHAGKRRGSYPETVSLQENSKRMRTRQVRRRSQGRKKKRGLGRAP